jgi:hypothetical protein
MNQDRKHWTPRMPQMMGKLSHANQYLKVISAAALGTAILTLVTLLGVLNRDPVVLTLKADASVLDRAGPPKLEDQVRAAARQYLASRYQWDAATVKQRLAEAQAFIAPASLKAFQTASIVLIRFSAEKQVTQRIYADNLQVDLNKHEVEISGDRLTSVQGLMAAGALRLVLKFEDGPKTVLNPWGWYVLQEKEVQ